jgi:hypothetical protein
MVLRLLAEGAVVVLVMALGCWGMANLGSHTLAAESDSLMAQQDPIYVAGCPLHDPLEKGSAQQGGMSESKSCSREGSSHPITSRQPGGGLVEHARGAERQ